MANHRVDKILSFRDLDRMSYHLFPCLGNFSDGIFAELLK